MVSYHRASDVASRLKKLRGNGQRNSTVTAMIVHRISPSIRKVFGERFFLIEEGAGLYGHKFDHAFAACSPTLPKMSFWWREVAARCEGGAVEFL